MDKYKEKIRVYDQWLYRIEDEEENEERVIYTVDGKQKLENRIVYSTEDKRIVYNTVGKHKPNKRNYMKLIIDKDIVIIEWMRGRGKSPASQLILNKKKKTCIYHEIIPDVIYMEKIPKGDILIHYMDDLDGQKDGTYTLTWCPHKNKSKRKRKNLQKDLSEDIENIDSKQKEYIKELIKYIKTHIEVLEYKEPDDIEEKEETEEETTPKKYNNTIKNLNIPSSLYIVDREYKFVGSVPGSYYYEYNDKHDKEYRLLEIREVEDRYDINMTFRENMKAKDKYILNIGYNNKNNLVVKFSTIGKGNIVVDTPNKTYIDEKGRKSTQIKLNDVKFSKKETYRENEETGKTEIISNIKIRTSNDQYVLKSDNKHYFLDKNGESYYISGSEYGLLDNIAIMAPGIYNNINENFPKLKQKRI